MMIKFIYVTILLGIMAIASILIVNINAKDDDLTKVGIAEINRDILYMPQYIAINQGYFKEEGLNVKILTVDSLDEALSSILISDSQIILSKERDILNVNTDENILSFLDITSSTNKIVYSSTEYYINSNTDIIKKISNAINKALIYIRDHKEITLARKTHVYFYNIEFNSLKNKINNLKKDKTWNINKKDSK